MKAIIILAALALAACGTSEPGSNAAAAANSAEPATNAAQGNVAAQVVEMGERTRNMVFVRALIDANLDCDAVVSSTRLEDRNGLPTWRAECKNGESHMIQITPDGTANIVSRAGS